MKNSKHITKRTHTRETEYAWIFIFVHCRHVFYFLDVERKKREKKNEMQNERAIVLAVPYLCRAQFIRFCLIALFVFVTFYALRYQLQLQSWRCRPLNLIKFMLNKKMEQFTNTSNEATTTTAETATKSATHTAKSEGNKLRKLTENENEIKLEYKLSSTFLLLFLPPFSSKFPTKRTGFTFTHSEFESTI